MKRYRKLAKMPQHSHRSYPSRPHCFRFNRSKLRYAANRAAYGLVVQRRLIFNIPLETNIALLKIEDYNHWLQTTVSYFSIPNGIPMQISDRSYWSTSPHSKIQHFYILDGSGNNSTYLRNRLTKIYIFELFADIFCAAGKLLCCNIIGLILCMPG